MLSIKELNYSMREQQERLATEALFLYVTGEESENLERARRLLRDEGSFSGRTRISIAASDSQPIHQTNLKLCGEH